MKKLGIIVAVLLALYGCWELKYPSGTWRYKLTLVVDDNGKQVTGSAVREVRAFREPKIFPEQPAGHAGVRGEAVVVDLGPKGTLFAILKDEKIGNDYGYYIVFLEFPIPGDVGELTPEGIRYYSNLKDGKHNMSFDKLPLLVRFRDINDPKTIEKVDPNDLEKTFGPGVKLVSATIEMTDEPITKEIEKHLPWLKNIKGGYLDGGFTSRNAPLGLHGGDFEMGGK